MASIYACRRGYKLTCFFLSRNLQPGDPSPKAPIPGSLAPAANNTGAGIGVGLYALVVIGGVLAYFGYQYMQQQQTQQA